MIAHLNGEVTEVTLDRAVIDCAGIGHWFYATPNTLSQLFVGQTAKVYTQLVVREDALTLFGFETIAERQAFNILIGVNGVGPKLALATLAVYPPSQLAQIMASKDEAALTRIPGVGKKSAQRLLVEIGDKLAGLAGEGADLVPSSITVPLAEGYPEVVQALEQMGWKKAIAEKAVAEVVAEGEKLSVPEVLRAALQSLGRGR